jgi:hypothetical protein
LAQEKLVERYARLLEEKAPMLNDYFGIEINVIQPVAATG